MARTSSKDGSDIGDGPALPASANWARTTQQRSRRGSHATSGAASSPAISTSLPVTAESPRAAGEVPPIQETSAPAAPTAPTAPTSRKAEKQPAVDATAKSNTPAAKSSARKTDVLDFSAILKILAACPASAFAPPKDTTFNYPPLFDINGGERRRILREEEEARLGDVTEEVQPDNAEPTDDEPGSGSLALGGEPEEREQGRSGSAFDQRRGHAQPPIQRANADGPFGPSLSAFGSGSAATPVSGRTMTPQQAFVVRPQGSFVDQMPPGLPAQQSSLFQGQGHGRHGSRFNFGANDTSSSTNVKIAADPRILAQQTSMMPTSYRSQPGGPFYTGGGSMPGPPPGLKTSGTPPVGGSMFGQGHGFGGSAFGSKENSNELLQSLIRGRGAGNGQAQDAGKREYLSFSNQYPSSSTSSTPAPASGLMATLYGTQPGAFRDFGLKQKKKGKKHRHANTSSSGGSGLVDLADPSIVHAGGLRHQQQGNNAGVGQGLFGGQSQGGYNPNMMYGSGGYGRWGS